MRSNRRTSIDQAIQGAGDAQLAEVVETEMNDAASGTSRRRRS
jgi:hypothetical protein